MKYFNVLLIILWSTFSTFGESHELKSPDGKTEVLITINTQINIEVYFQSQLLFSAKNIHLVTNDNLKFGVNSKVINIERSSINRVIFPPIKEKYSIIHEQFNELKLNLNSNSTFIFRAYNEGVAYRFATNIKDSLTIMKENLNIELNETDSAYYQLSESFNSSYETPYQHNAIKNISTDGFVCLPFLIEKHNGNKILITESDLKDYPGLWIKATGTSTLGSTNPPFPIAFKDDGSPYGQGQVTKSADYIAITNGERNFPWRVFCISENESELLSNTLVYQLAKPSQIKDISWIQPGVVTFDWWGRRNIYGTDFKAGINTATAKYFIDFAAEFGFEYFLFDDGWSKQDDLFEIHPDLNLEEVVEYANKQNVKIMLWVIWNTFEKQKEAAWDQFEKWGISGIKFDFMNRDDQKMVQFYYEVAKEAAKRKMVIDFHGAYKPAGLRRAFPNVLTFEALIEFEYNGWTDFVSPDHDNLLPYLRMVTGPMDYIPYTTHNAQKKNFRPVGDMPMGQGTRAHSLALSVILESPMRMLPDSPSDYYREEECTEFYSKIPVEWDDLKVLEAKIGDYTLLARRNGDDWYIGAITDWIPREFEINFDFLSDGIYEMEYIEDGINADVRAIDYKLKKINVTKNDIIKIKLAPGGGWIARIMK
ncbi:MAG: glycoside hydrolase family 97 protein [Ignavibacteriales bacterium]|nr:glycoside hydrolase family 97 protein [Ignavibacteriales bacterium]